MNTFAFEASCVICEHPDRECHLVGFADQKHGAKHYLMLQRSFEDDEQDVRLAMNTYHVEWCSQEYACYGGISRFILMPSRAEIALEPSAAQAFAGLSHLSISFQLSTVEQTVLKEALSQIFAESLCLEVADA